MLVFLSIPMNMRVFTYFRASVWAKVSLRITEFYFLLSVKRELGSSQVMDSRFALRYFMLIDAFESKSKTILSYGMNGRITFFYY